MVGGYINLKCKEAINIPDRKPSIPKPRPANYRKNSYWKIYYVCSECGRSINEIYDMYSYISYDIIDELRYCPFCGAKMEGDK